MRKKVRYPLGMQTFSKIIEEGRLYIDKTGYVYDMTHTDSAYIFLSRPRRFGKSLLVSTLHSYFEGRRELFNGLKIEALEEEWTEYPVIHLDMSGGKHLDKSRLEEYLLDVIDENSRRLGVTVETQSVNIGLTHLISRANEKYKQKVVVLIDEYDAPLLDVVHDDGGLSELRQVMRNFYSPLKKCDPMLRFVFITGITKFSQLSIFSELNNLKNISMHERYAGICGITEEEMLSQMDAGIGGLAAERGITKGEAVKALKENYDGYHFSWPSPDVYNPFSLLNALSDMRLDSYWFSSGTPTFLIEMLRKFHVLPSQVCSPLKSMASGFDAPTERMTSIVPLLYQSGYVTIKDFDPRIQLYVLDVPNKEIRIGLMQSLLPNYLGTVSVEGGATVAMMQGALLNDDVDEALSLLQSFLATVPQTDNTGYEGHWQQMLYVIFSLLGMTVDVEVRTPKGRVDLVAKTANKLYVVELKMDRSAEAAMSQIDLKEYPQRFALSGLPVVKVGVNFSLEGRNITDWRIG